MCQICDHPQHAAIDLCITNGDSLRKIGTMFGTDKNAVQRHKNICMKRTGPVLSPAPVPVYQTPEQVAVTERVSISIINRVSSLVAVLEQQATECASDKDRRNMTATATALLKALELNARLTGELGPNGQVYLQVNMPSLTTAPEYPILMKVLDRHPEIRQELTAALQEAGL